jgi:hypothetical protein
MSWSSERLRKFCRIIKIRLNSPRNVTTLDCSCTVSCRVGILVAMRVLHAPIDKKGCINADYVPDDLAITGEFPGGCAV